jgi:signal transduction histidine kinase
MLARHRNLLIDATVAALAFALTLATMRLPEDQASDRDPDALAVLIAAIATLPLLWWRRAVLAVLVVATIGTALLSGLGYPDGPPIGPGVALFYLGLSGARVRGSLRLTIALVVGALAVHLTAQWIDTGGVPVPELLLGGPIWFAAWAVGDRLRLRRERMEQLQERAERAERERERERQLAVAEERTRIARDLHDSAGHAISVILVHAGAARLLRERDPERASRALETIEDVARETLGEIDQLVHALRDEDGVLLEPPAGLAALDSLLQRHRDAGLDVELEVAGDRRPLGAGVDRAAYRILQESLTNALRHGSGPAQVTLAYEDHSVALSVTNPAALDGAIAAGHGIVGMRERAMLVGGRLDAARANGAFQVRARLPYAAEETE